MTMTMPTLLNGAQIRARRVARGLTIAKLAAQLGISSDLARALEGGATSRAAALPLAVLVRLAHTLQLAPAELFTASAPDPVAASADDRAIEAALLAHGDTITTDSVADTLGWPLGRLEHALWQRLDHAHQEQRGLTAATATRLCLLVRGIPLASDAWEGDGGLRQLRQQQLIEGEQPPFRLSADVRYSLLLDEYE